ncbi:hypothetical protein FBUS_01934 [Fasciolopsis buskii]|uniref:Uncharacterized protein n=1 Tax=Fasciolopsis buskii TaxID=27845 RepID=A0A8E0S113_9TREM|nr:hypothetical protein FBUS_01934 [Fasciolopsis buski]
MGHERFRMDSMFMHVLSMTTALNLSSFETYFPDGPKKWYLPTAISICAGAILFFTVEFILRRIRNCLESRSSKRDPLRTVNSVAITNGCCIPVLNDRPNYADFPYRLREPVAHGDQHTDNPLVNIRLSDHESHKPATLLTKEVEENNHHHHDHQQSEKSGCCGSRVCFCFPCVSIHYPCSYDQLGYRSSPFIQLRSLLLLCSVFTTIDQKIWSN